MEFPWDRGPRTPPRSPAFFAFSGVGLALDGALRVLQLRPAAAVPNVSLTMENLADFVSAYIIRQPAANGVPVLGVPPMVFPDEVGRDPERALESLTVGGFAEVFEDEYEARHNRRNGDGSSRRCAAGASVACDSS